jgi:diguanylate cyclase (GGDEF)-like protein
MSSRDHRGSKSVFVEHRTHAYHDPLTGLYSRQHFVTQLQRLLGGRPGTSSVCALLVVDVDNFTRLNHSLGCTVADQYLKRVAVLLRAHAGRADLLGRIGSDEFAVVISDIDQRGAVEIAERFRAALTDTVFGGRLSVSVAVVALDGARPVSAESALTSADMAIDDARAAGGDRTVIYDADAASALDWMPRIRDAIANDRFVLYEQPIIDLRRNVVRCHELLIRMLDDSGQLIPPANFIPVAERFGVIGEIDRWVIREGLKLAKRGRRVTINLSAQSLSDRSIVDSVLDAVSLGLDPRNVIFELTETAAVTHAREAGELTRLLARIGCDLALDDFGTGFGSFTSLKQFPARFLKIDAEFVRDMRFDENDREVVRLICGVAHVLGKQTIAEGVEDGETLEILRSQGVDHAQGYFIGRPAPVASAQEAAARRSASS